MLKIGVISSSNGGAFKAFYKIAGLSPDQVIIITDRPCGIEQFATDKSIDHVRIDSSDNDEFSRQAKVYFESKGGVQAIFLFFTRLITPSLFERYLTINFHPSLLPAFRGFSPTKRALEAGVKYFGTTAHIINANADEGEIICQSCIPIKPDHTEESLERVSFIQKTYQMALIREMLEADCIRFVKGEIEVTEQWPVSILFNPAIKSQETLRRLTLLDLENNAGVFNLEY